MPGLEGSGGVVCAYRSRRAHRCRSIAKHHAMSPIRLILLILVIAYSAAFFGPSRAFAAAQRDRSLEPTPPFRLSAPVRVPRQAAPPLTLGQRAVNFARGLIGSPYRWGGDSPATGFDCSGFVRFVYGHFGLSLPHSSYADFNLGRRVTRGKLEPGDLVFFDGVGHVGLYIGGGRFIHAPHTGTSVQITSLADSWYSATYDGARRLLLQPARRLVKHAAGAHGTAKATLAVLNGGLGNLWPSSVIHATTAPSNMGSAGETRPSTPNRRPDSRGR